MGLLGIFASAAATVLIAVAGVVYAVRRADALAWILAASAVLSAVAFAAQNWVAVRVMGGDPTAGIAIMRVLGPASTVVGVVFGVTLALVLFRDSKRPV